MRCKPSACSGCSLHSHGSDFSAVEGTGANGVLLVGEASGQMEQRDCLPFRPYAPSGSVLERCLRRMGLDRQSFSLTNCVRCRPRRDFLENAPWEYSALRHCRPNLDQVISERKPRVIVALGGVALRELTGEAGEARGVTHLAGYVLPFSSARMPCDNCISHDSLSVPPKQRMTDASCDQCHGSGYVSRPNTIPVIADFHPSYLRRGKASHQGVFSRILQRALQIAQGRDRDWMWGIDPDDESTWNTPDGGRLQYWTHPTLDQCWSVYNYLKDNPQVVVAKDLETYESASIDEDARDGFQDTEIRTFQLSLQAGSGLSIPYRDEFREVIRAFILLKNKFYGHNWNNFDHKVIRACAAREGWKYAPSDWCYDTLDMFHHWQPDLPAHLQFCASFVRFPFPWKHLAGTDIEFYGIADVDSDLRLGLWLEQMLRKDGLWDDQNYLNVISGRGGITTSVPSANGNGYTGTENVRTRGSELVSYVLEPTADKNQIRGYVGQVRSVRPVLAAMEDRGVPVDDTRRVALRAEFDRAQRKLGAEIAARAPGECRRVHPKEGYKGVPPEVKKLLDTLPTGAGTPTQKQQEEYVAERRFQDPSKCACGSPMKRDDDGVLKCPACNSTTPKEEGEWYTYQRCLFSEVTPDIREGELVISFRREVERWCRIYDFNPNSAPQLLAYMRAKHHPVPKSKEENEHGEHKDTTAAKELQRLAVKTGDNFYLKCIEYRGYTKLKGTYVEGFKPGVDRKVHTTFTFDTAIAQLSSRNPNVQNFTKLKPTPELAQAMRGMIAATDGHVIEEWDYRSCHALTLGYLAESPNWIRMARIDIHSIIAGHFLNLWDARELMKLSNPEIKAKCKWLKSDPERKRVRDDQAKHGILGIGNGLKANGLYERYMESFPPRPCPECAASGKVRGMRGLKNCPQCEGSGKQSGRSTAKQVLDVCEIIGPEVFAWQRRMQDQAHREQFLRTEFGHIRRFYEVFRWDGKKGAWGHGDQAEEAIAFWLANIAFAHIREALKELDRRGLAEKYGLFNNVHDSFMFHFPEEMLEESRHEIAPVLLAPSKVLTNPKVALGGLVIDVEASWGRNWAEMQELEVPRVSQEVSCVGA